MACAERSDSQQQIQDVGGQCFSAGGAMHCESILANDTMNFSEPDVTMLSQHSRITSDSNGRNSGGYGGSLEAANFKPVPPSHRPSRQATEKFLSQLESEEHGCKAMKHPTVHIPEDPAHDPEFIASRHLHCNTDASTNPLHSKHGFSESDFSHKSESNERTGGKLLESSEPHTPVSPNSASGLGFRRKKFRSHESASSCCSKCNSSDKAIQKHIFGSNQSKLSEHSELLTPMSLNTPTLVGLRQQKFGSHERASSAYDECACSDKELKTNEFGSNPLSDGHLSESSAPRIPPMSPKTGPQARFKRKTGVSNESTISGYSKVDVSDNGSNQNRFESSQGKDVSRPEYPEPRTPTTLDIASQAGFRRQRLGSNESRGSGCSEVDSSGKALNQDKFGSNQSCDANLPEYPEPCLLGSFRGQKFGSHENASAGHIKHSHGQQLGTWFGPVRGRHDIQAVAKPASSSIVHETTLMSIHYDASGTLRADPKHLLMNALACKPESWGSTQHAHQKVECSGAPGHNLP